MTTVCSVVISPKGLLEKGCSMEEKLPSDFKKPTSRKEFEELCNLVGLRKAMEIAEIFPHDPPDLQNSDRADTRDSV